MKNLYGITAFIVVVGVAPAARAERIPLGVSLETRGFERIAHRKGVKVYKHKQSDIIRLGAEARFQASVDEVLRVLLDYDSQVGTIDRLSEVRVLGRHKKSLVVYQRLNLPVISDRDFNLKVSWWRKGDSTWVAYHAIHKRGRPPRDGVVRVTRHVGSWQLKPARGGGTNARFQVAIDLAGWLPKWMARSGSGKEVPELFTSINKLIKRSRYRSATCTSNCL